MEIDKAKSQTAATELRRRAEELLQAKTADQHPPRTGEEAQRLVHELEVHQIELEMQNAELRQARDEVEAALDKYTDLYDFAPVGYVTLARDGVVLAANLTTADFLGIERSRLLGQRFGMFVAAETLLFTEFLGKVFASHGKVSCEVTLASKGKPPLFVQINAMAAASGHECRAAIIDITERKLMNDNLRRAKEELEQRVAERTAELVLANDRLRNETNERLQGIETLNMREKLLRLYFDRMPLGCIVWDRQFRVTAWNPAAERIFGFTAAEALGRRPFGFIVPLQLEEQLATILERLSVGDLTAHSINENLTRDGRTIICEWTNTPLVDDRGEVIGAISMAQDITERKRIETSLLDSEERYRALVETTNDWIWEVDDQGRYTYVSPRIRNLLGYAPEELFGRTPFDFMTEEEAHRVGELFADIVAERRPFASLENVNRHRNGKKVVLETSGVPVFDATGEFRGYRGIDRDITERKQESEILLARLRLLEYSFTHTLDELLRATLDEAEKLTDSRIGFYHFLEEDQHTLSLQAWSTRTAAEFCTAEGAGSHYDIAEAGVWVDCVHERRPVIHNDYASLLHRKGMPKGHATVVREMVVPVFRGDRIVAILGVGNKPAEYTEHDIAVAALVADLAWEIVELRIVENKLRISEERLALAQKSAGSGLWDWDMTSGLLTWSPELFDLFGLDPSCSDASFDTWHRVLHPDDVQAASDRIEHAVKDGTTLHNEYRIILPDGQIRWINALGRTMYDQEGRPVRMSGICIDVTERARMDQAFRDSELLFRTLCDSAPLGIFKTDRHYNTIYRNPRWYSIFGLDGAESLDTSWSEAIYRDDREQAYTAWREATFKGLPYAHEYRIVTTRGEAAWVRALASPIRNPDGTVTGYVGTMEDITEIRLAREELLKAQKLESLGVLAGGIAHDFNNFLTSIVGNISLAEFHRQNPEMVAQLLLEAESAAIQAKSLTQQLLTFAKGGEPVKKIIRMGDLVRDAVGFATRGSAVRCEFSLPEDLWPVEADEGQLRQVIHNLAINAVQAMPDGGTLAVAAINAFSLTEAKRYVELSVSDTGTGIPANHLPKIFDPYFTTKQHGSGLGLATCYSIITRHAGTITVTSTLGQGSTFKVRIPATGQATAPAEEPRKPLTVGVGSVLVMDDERPVRKIAQAMLESLGYRVECAINGDEAVELYRGRLEEGNPFDVVIMDLTIPGGRGGKDALQELLKIDPSARVVVSSGYSTDSVLADYREYGFCAVLDKPYRLLELGEVMQEVHGITQGSPAAPKKPMDC